ncbi:hypothetical protein VNO77_24794 [Canavalia gladiata]|uniref:Uncharacterized protein n=1 Tax=Canavalia gladiata TaxID=3824 RepID=A0AAN9L6Y2_CANGL
MLRWDVVTWCNQDPPELMGLMASLSQMTFNKITTTSCRMVHNRKFLLTTGTVQEILINMITVARYSLAHYCSSESSNSNPKDNLR